MLNGEYDSNFALNDYVTPFYELLGTPQQNTTALQAAAVQESTGISRQQTLTLASDSELNRLVMSDYRDLDEEEQARVYWLDRSFWMGMQGLYGQWRLGALPDPEWSFWHRIICNNATSTRPTGRRVSGGRLLWEQGNRTALIPEFVEFVESTCSREGEDALVTPAER